jgi:uncharacterized protein (DUF1800 family)
MKRLSLMIAAAALLVTAITLGAMGPFDQKLSPEQQILQALNRMTFGPRPGDVEEVRRLGVSKWIEAQLHPEQIAENPALDAKLKPLESLSMKLPDLVKEYSQQPQSMMMAMAAQPRQINDLLPREDAQKVLSGATEDRVAVLNGLDADKRKEVLANLPVNLIPYTGTFKKEAEEIRKARDDERQKEFRRRNPQLRDLLNADQISIATSGNREQLASLFAYLDPEKRAQVAGVLPPQSLAMLPENLRRDGQLHRTPQMVASQDTKEGKVLRALYSNRQLEEVLVDFWYNHFNVDQAKNLQRGNLVLHTLIGSYERDAIRPNVLGHFKDLLLATARHPAMLYYLDNWESMSPSSIDVGPFAPQRGFFNGVPNAILPSAFSRLAHGLNENYGREIMELHTLGVKGGYTQQDVIAVARCFTGWTVRDTTDPQFVFAPFMHDFSEKTVLGHKIAAGGGEQDGLQVIDILAHHPSTAKFISLELAQRFVADDPPPALVERMAQTFTKTDGDLRAVLRTMFTSPEFMSEGAWQTKVKSPFEMVISAVRAVGGETSDAYTLVQKIADLGQPLYSKVEPNGYPNTGDLWLSTTGVMGRMNFSSALAFGLVPGVKLDQARLAGKDKTAITRDLLGHEASPQTQTALEKGLEGKEQTPPFIASLVLASPDFQRR